MEVDKLTADAPPAQVNEKVFEGIGRLQAEIDHARAKGGVTAIMVMMSDIDAIEARIRELAQAYVGSLMQRQDLDYLQEMNAAEQEAIERQQNPEGWA